MALRFMDGQPSEQLRGDLSQACALQDDEISLICQAVFDYLSSQDIEKMKSKVADISKEHGKNINSVRAAARGLVNVIHGSVVRQASNDDLSSDLTHLGFSQSQISPIVNLFQQNRSEVGQAALSHTLKVNELLDIQWRFGVTSSNSEIRHLGSTFLQMKLTLDMGNEKKNVSLELTLQQFYEFLAQMEKAKAFCDFMS